MPTERDFGTVWEGCSAESTRLTTTITIEYVTSYQTHLPGGVAGEALLAEANSFELVAPLLHNETQPYALRTFHENIS